MSGYKTVSNFLLLICLSTSLFSQAEHHCLSESHFHGNEVASKAYHEKLAQIFAEAEKKSDPLELITIPVVVHVLYNTTAQNISDAQIQSQIDVLNTAFDLEAPWIQTYYPQATDVEIEFVLANVDPLGNPTLGITRTFTSHDIFDIDYEGDLVTPENTAMKLDASGGKNAWPTTDYLNIWVINMNYILKGFGTFPNTIDPAYDGIVMNYKYFGNIESGASYANYAEGKSCVHEVGHWLGLRHLFANNDCNINDGILDTPAQSEVYYSCAAPIEECGNSLMLENYMQYTYDQCQLVFTEGQSLVMRNSFNPGEGREEILNSNGYLNLNTGRISGTIWYDENHNGLIESIEPGAQDLPIHLFTHELEYIISTNTKQDGSYSFINLPPDTYFLGMETPDGFAIIPQSDQDYYFHQSLGENSTPLYSLATDQHIQNLNAGLGLGTVDLSYALLETTLEEDHVRLVWESTTSTTYQKYSIERKANDQDWTTIFLSSVSEVNSYQDYEIENNTNYLYRILFENDQAKQFYSEVSTVKVNWMTESKFTFNNPVHQNLDILYQNIKGEQIKIGLFDQTQRRLLDQSIDLNMKESGQHSIDLNQLYPGLYFLKVEINHQTSFYSLIKV